MMILRRFFIFTTILDLQRQTRKLFTYFYIDKNLKRITEYQEEEEEEREEEEEEEEEITTMR